MAVIGREAKIAVELETLFANVDQQFAESSIIDLPAIMMPLEHFIGEVFQQRGKFDLVPALARNGDVWAFHHRAVGAKEGGLLDRTAVAVAIETDLDVAMPCALKCCSSNAFIAAISMVCGSRCVQPGLRDNLPQAAKNRS
jgi:hypothetical protein